MADEFVSIAKAAPSDPVPTGISLQGDYQRLPHFAQLFFKMYKQVSWVRACVDIIADTATAEPCIVKKVGVEQELDDQDNDPRVKALKVVLDLINPSYDNMELANMNIRAMEINGTSYNRILRKAGGKQMVGLQYISFTRVKPNVDNFGNLVSWSVKSKRGTSSETVPARDIAAFRLPHPDDDLIGLAPLESLDLPVALDMQALKFNEASFRNGPYASLIMTMKSADPTVIQRNREYVKNEYTKPENAHKPMLLEGEVEVNSDATRKNADGSFIELRRFNREEIAAVFHVPLTKLGITEKSNRSNTEENDNTFVRDTIEPIQRIYWAQFNRRILQQELGIYDMICQPGKKQDVNMTLANVANKMLQSGASVNEARKVQNLAPKKGDEYDVPFVTKTVVPVDDENDDVSSGQPIGGEQDDNLDAVQDEQDENKTEGGGETDNGNS